MIGARHCIFATIPLALHACAPSPSGAMNVTNTTEMPVEQLEAPPPPPTTVALLKDGKPEACGSQDVKDTITKMAFPKKGDAVKQAAWQRRTSSFRINYSLTTASSIDSSINEVSCETTLTARGGGLEQEFRLTYTVAPSLDDPTTFVVTVDNLSGPRAFFYWRLVEQVQKEEAQDRQAIEDAAPRQSEPEDTPAVLDEPTGNFE